MVSRAWVCAGKMNSSAPRVAIIAALPRELAGLTAGWQRQNVTRNGQIAWTASSSDALAIAAGMGRENASRALELAVESGPVSAVISAGFAGALDPALQVGDAVQASTVIDAQTGERFTTAGGDGRSLVTIGAVADTAEKRRLRETYAAHVADMEAATLARICAGRGLPFFAIKAISDAADFSLPALAKFATAQGQFRTAAFVLHVALRPVLWGQTRELARGARAAQAALSGALRAFLSADAAQHLS
jgi:adenosylhomocysteine nucleosidase